MKLFKCPFCSIKSPKQSNINKHVDKVHEKEKALKGEKKVRDEKRKAIDDGPSTVQIGPNSVVTEGFKNKKRGLEKTFDQNDSNLTDNKFKKEA